MGTKHTTILKNWDRAGQSLEVEGHNQTEIQSGGSNCLHHDYFHADRKSLLRGLGRVQNPNWTKQRCRNWREDWDTWTLRSCCVGPNYYAPRSQQCPSLTSGGTNPERRSSKDGRTKDESINTATVSDEPHTP